MTYARRRNKLQKSEGNLLTVACPSCGAKAGSWCISQSTGKQITSISQQHGRRGTALREKVLANNGNNS